MRWLAAVFVSLASALMLWASLTGSVAHSQRRPGTKARGHDHLRHQLVAAKAGTETNCQSCHTLASLAVSSQPTHRWCFGSCHAAPSPAVKPGQPYVVARAQRRLCETCHLGTDLDNAARGTPFPVLPTSFAGGTEFGAELSHATHSSAGCESCHREDLAASANASPGSGQPRRGAVHRRCIRCHKTSNKSPTAKSTFAIANCERCHRGSESRRAIRSPFSALRFSHQKHAPRVKQANNEVCESCHRGAKSEPTRQVASPTKAQCRGCHDGGKAFSMTTNQCRRCHAAAREQSGAVRVEPILLRHKSHIKIACGTCHGSDGSFAADRGHAMCSNQDCHPSELEARRPTICSSCHVGNEPWLPQHIDRPRRVNGDFGSNFDHRMHAALKNSRASECFDCHRGDPGGKNVGIETRIHSSCGGNGCHDKGETRQTSKSGKETVEPLLRDCDGCHQLGGRAKRRALDAARQFSVSQKFAHQTHRADPDGARLACQRCHDLARGPGPGRDIARAEKTTCVPCHNGEQAFKITGHGCARCH